MQQLSSVWNSLNTTRRILIIGATAIMFVAILAMSKIASTPKMSLLYAGMDGSAAGEVVAALEQKNANYEVRGEAIYVDAAQRDELRMMLAAEGLPANGAQGYELLDSLTGFGTTSQMFDAAYWRAKEGELARTILANPNIQSARVHLSNTSSSPFQKNTELSASVTVSGNAAAINATNARALKYLVASAVAGLDPESVTIIDGRAGVVVGGDEFAANGHTADKAAELRRSVERILEARVGVGKAIVEINVETQTDRESIFERTFDPDSRVAISTDTEERSTNANESGSGGVTVASNLPDGDAAAQNDMSSSQNNEIRERTNYEVSEVKREIIRTPGAVKRLTVAVLVDGVRSINAAGEEEFALRSDEELAALGDLVASSVGFDEARGDIMTIKSMAFEPIDQLGELADASISSPVELDMMSIIQLLVVSAVALILGLFVVRPLLVGRSVPQLEQAAIAPPLPDFQEAEAQALNGEIDTSDFPHPATVTDFDLPELGDLPALPMADGFAGPVSDDPVARLREMIKERQEETVATLKSWMEDEETV
ncbi:flagellar basal-body MS-ring/collar protein FliF [Falsihalocynthiibacter sp. SS001]|uniref:flagellar basal-body MS-ring/collar protein FliF n=1 Tax=Falsihalocynthiibacter sp. SS001 TaxID=3349698 RepID=UPI0036D22E3A